MKASNVKGINEVAKKLNKEIQRIKNRSVAGIMKAAILITNDVDKTPPLIPVDTGNLRDSKKLKPITKGEIEGVEIGYHANYASYIHELVDSKVSSGKVNWSRPNSGPKFLQSSLERNHDQILKIIELEAKVK